MRFMILTKLFVFRVRYFFIKLLYKLVVGMLIMKIEDNLNCIKFNDWQFIFFNFYQIFISVTVFIFYSFIFNQI